MVRPPRHGLAIVSDDSSPPTDSKLSLDANNWSLVEPGPVLQKLKPVPASCGLAK